MPVLLQNRAWQSPFPPSAHSYVGTTHTTVAPYHVRDGARLMPYAGRLWMFGGWYPDAPAAPWYPTTTTNEVWSAPLDNLANWQRDLTHAEDPPASGPGARWRRRHTFPVCELNGKIWILGGDLNDGYKSDVWSTSDPGNANGWERFDASAPWGPNVYDWGYGTYRGLIHIFGGWDMNDSQRACRRHWTFDGTTYAQLPDMPFSVGSSSRAVVVGDVMLVCAGGSGRYGAGAGEQRRNWTWAFNGHRWKQMSATASWSAGIWPVVESYDNRLWVATRSSYTHGNQGGLFASDTLGRTWVDVSGSAPWTPSHADGSCVTVEHGIVLASGNDLGKNVYSLKAAP